VSKRRTSEPLMKWLDAQIERDGTRAQVDELVNEIRIEQKLAALRRKRGLTQTQLAKRLGVSQPVLARIEAGHIKNLQLKTLVRTAAALGAKVKIDIEPVRAR
jgi:DNA-binding XRE family transcriptional regulator